MSSTKSPGIDASTAACRSALKWECPKSVSGISNRRVFPPLLTLSINMFAQLLRSNHEQC